MSAAATQNINLSYREALRNRHVAGLDDRLNGGRAAWPHGRGPLIALAGTSGGLVLSGVLTLVLLPIAALAVLKPVPAGLLGPRLIAQDQQA